jgi:alanine racemase
LLFKIIHMPRPLLATIHFAALAHNLAVAKKCAPNSKAWAVVKANAYGHGLARGMRGFAAADGLGLIEPDAAVRLREMGWQKPILLLEGCFDATDMRVVEEHGLEIVVHCNEQIDMLEKSAISTSVDVHLKMNSGMNRLGFTPEKFRAAHARLRALAAVRNITLMTHFANAGASVGYGSCFIADRTMTIGVVACGYADGYPRHAPNGTPVIVDGIKTTLVGRVSMDLMTVDLTHVAAARVGSDVTLWGGDLPIDEVANAAGTIGYELMCALAPRVAVVER